MAQAQIRLKAARQFQSVTIRVPDGYEYYNLKQLSHLVHGMPLDMAIFTKIIKPLGDKAEKLERLEKEQPEDMQVFTGNPKVITLDIWAGRKHYLFAAGKEWLCPCMTGATCPRPERRSK